MASSTQLTIATLRTAFFSYLFGEEQSGFLCIATSDPNAQKTSFKQKFFEWPGQKDKIVSFVEQRSKTHNVWFCVNLLENAVRNKENAMPMNFVWADLDLVTPNECDPLPTAVVRSSPGRYQAFWRVDASLMPADVCEFYSRKIAYKVGADKSGWDLTQLLRVPFTRNFKYPDGPEVELLHALDMKVPQETFELLPDPTFVSDDILVLDEPGVPSGDDLPDVVSVIYKFNYQLHDTGFNALYSNVPHESDDWSRLMWRLINICLEVGMTEQEAFAVCLHAKCNKYTRDNRPPSYLWREVVKANGMLRKQISDEGILKPLLMPDLVNLDDIYRQLAQNFISEYKEWAVGATDAVEEYHELCCFVLLSSVVCSGLYLKASFGELAPNLWGLVLGDSTLTRKTTAMNMAKDMLLEIDPDVLFASDGSAEGVISALAARPNRTSMFFKDEVTGFFDSINRKDYLAGMPELFTQLYDVPKVLPRQLRKETITITKPYFIFFGGGIKDKVHTLLNDDYVLSGFMPRFLVVSGDADLSKIRPTGPADDAGTASKENIMDRVKRLHTIFTETAEIIIAGQVTSLPKRYEAKLTPEAWELFKDFEMQLVQTASNSSIPMLALPTFTRLAFSMLKMSMILAACDNDPNPENNTVTVEYTHVQQAAYYVQKWGKYSIELIQNTGISFTERNINNLLRTIKRLPGATKSRLMQNTKFSSREMNDMLQTMADRGLIRVEKEGRGIRLWPVEH